MSYREQVALAIFLSTFWFTSFTVRAATIIVTSTNDSGPGSLRGAIAAAGDGDTITFAVTGTIGLTSGELFINSNITISGPGANMLTITRNSPDSLLHLPYSAPYSYYRKALDHQCSRSRFRQLTRCWWRHFLR